MENYSLVLPTSTIRQYIKHRSLITHLHLSQSEGNAAHLQDLIRWVDSNPNSYERPFNDEQDSIKEGIITERNLMCRCLWEKCKFIL